MCHSKSAFHTVHSLSFPSITLLANRGQCSACIYMNRADTPTPWQWGHLQRAWSVAVTVNILITGNHRHSSNASEWSPPSLALGFCSLCTCQDSMQEQIMHPEGKSCRSAKCANSVTFFLCDYTSVWRGREAKNCINSKGKGKKALSPLWFPIVPQQSCLLQWYVLSSFSARLISLPATCFQDMDNYHSECCLIYCCWPVLGDLRTGCLFLLLSCKAGANMNFYVI